ncbi:hypothetical protein [Chryseobacterium populi]|uniref:Transposase n=1 Tax=Chryseobacterium populi TaxID=1144316 RepID=J2KLU8_9FLAO|nr:hypothetical protein [Chryseobacterium populi]EJL74033.1 hypothetical protein PMI13_01239 [Chryseobacterium populi]
MSTVPDYKKIYWDILNEKYPEKKSRCIPILEKAKLAALDIIKLNEIIFDTDKQTEIFNQRHRMYDEYTISQILVYQEENKLNNSQLARHFKLSRNSITIWKKKYKK